MLKLTNANATLQESDGASEHQTAYINPSAVFAVVVGNFGATSILSMENAWIGVKESADEVARMVDEAKGLRFSVDEMLTALAWSCPSETSATEFRDHINWLRKSFGLPVDAFGVPTNGRGV